MSTRRNVALLALLLASFSGATDYVYDGTSLPSGKVDAVSRPVSPTRISAGEWNTSMSAVDSVRSALKAGRYHGLATNAADVAPSGEGRLRFNNGILEGSEAGSAYHGIGHPSNVIRAQSVGIKPTNTAAANDAAIAAWFAAQSFDADHRPVGGALLFEGATYDFNNTIQVTRHVVLQGVSGAGFGRTRFRFTGSNLGIKFVSNAAGTVDGDDGSYSLMRDIIVFASSAVANKDGIWIEGYKVALERVQTYGWGRNGIRINASVGSVPPTNANAWRLDNCTTSFNGSHGLFVQGGDSNAGLANLHQSNSNGGYGIYDDSFLGNTYIAPQTLTNTSGGYWARGASQRNVFIGPYGEGDEPASLIDSPNVVVGSLVSPGITGSFQSLIGGSENNPILFSATGGGTISVGSLDGSKAFLKPKGTGETLPLQYKFGQDYSPYTNFYAWNYGDLNGYSGLQLAGERSQITSFPMAVQAGLPVMDSGLFLNTAHVWSSTAVPATGTWNIGDVVLKSDAAAGGKVGWYCTTAGTAGTYSEGKTATTAGTTAVTLNAASAVLKVGDVVTINATTRRITAISGTTLTMSGTIAAAGPGLAIAYSAPTWKLFGNIEGGLTDSSGTPGSATCNTYRCRFAVAAGASAATITSSVTTASSSVLCSKAQLDATATDWKVVPGSGSYVLTTNANATAAVTFDCEVRN
jgi:hypothetical protein